MAKTNKSGTMIFYVPDFLYVYTNSYEMSPTERISEEIPWTKQVGVGAPQREFPKKYHGQSRLGLGPQQREFPKKFHGQSRLVGPNRENFRRNSTDKAGWGWVEDRGL